jgi:NADH dehydrogenase
MRTVMLGCGFGGVYTAQCLLSPWLCGRREDVIRVSRNPYFEFKPLFTEVLGNRLPPESARYSLHSIFDPESLRIKTAAITGIDAQEHIVKTTKGNVRYDYLVISLGGGAQPFPSTKGASMFSLESLDECARLRDHISELASRGGDSPGRTGRRGRNTIAIIGAGPTGIEAATEIRYTLDAARNSVGEKSRRSPFDIRLIESADRILPNWGGNLRARAATLLKESDITVMTRTDVSRVAKGRIYLGGNRSIAADTVINCAGLRGLPIYESIGSPLDESGRLRVKVSLQIPNHPNIFAMGDAISTEAFPAPVPRSGQAAYQQARVIAENILASEDGKPLKRFKYLEFGDVVPVGGRRAIAQIFGVPLQGGPAWLLEKAVFLARIPGWTNRAKLLNSMALDPLVKRGEEYLETKEW